MVTNDKKVFLLNFNSDFTYSWIVNDTTTNKILARYDYKTENPLYYIIAEKEKSLLQEIAPLDTLEHFSVDAGFPINAFRSLSYQYQFQLLNYDGLHQEIKNLIQELNFDYSSNRMNISVERRTQVLNHKTLSSIIKAREPRLERIEYLIVENIVELNSKLNIKQVRYLDIISSKGKIHRIKEIYNPKSSKFKTNAYSHKFKKLYLNTLKRQYFSFPSSNANNYSSFFNNKFDIIESKGDSYFITYHKETINIYSLNMEKSLFFFEVPKKWLHNNKRMGAVKTDNRTIAFIPIPNRILGYDEKKHKVFKGLGIDHDDSQKEVFIFKPKSQRLYSKVYTIKEIEQISKMKGNKVFFENGTSEKIKNRVR